MEIDVNGHTYYIGMMKSRQQRNVLRRIGPLILKSKAVFAAMAVSQQTVTFGADGKPIEDAVDDGAIGALFDAAGPFANSLAEMKDEDFDYIFDTCLAVVKRKTAGTLQDIIVGGGELRFEDIKLPHQFQLIFAVLKENYESFFGGLPGQSNGAVT